MKRNIFTRILCLLLCINMLLPVKAAATLLEEDSITGKVYDGLTTNEMAYVDQFYDGPVEDYGSSYLNSNGEALKKWLSNADQGNRNRVNSGYLMLDEEVFKNSGKKTGTNGELEKNSDANWHMFKEFNARFLGPVADYFASGGASVVVATIDAAAYRLKFPWAGKSAYSYYTQLQQVYYEYITNLQNELNKVDNTFGNLAKSIKSVSDIAAESIRVTTETSVLMLSGKGKGSPLIYKVSGVDFDNKELIIQAKGTKGVKTRSVRFSELDTTAVLNNSFIEYDLSSLDPTIRNELLKKLNIEVKPGGVGTGEIAGLPYKYLQDSVRNVDEISGMTSKEKDALKKVKSIRDSEEIDLLEDMEAVEDVAQKLGIVNSTIQLFNSAADVSSQQKCYMNVLTNMSQYYLNMLCQWYKDVEAYEVPFGYGHVQRDIKDAIIAITKDVLDLQADASQELAKKKGWGVSAIYNTGKFAELILDISEAAGWTGIKDLFKTAELFGNEKIASRVSGASAIFSIAWNMVTANFLEFEDKASTIYNLKWSLDELLTNKENGLLVQYARERTHETACEIIRALDTMKILKLMGENLVEEYYLCDFYDSLDMEISSAAHLVLRNEMAKRTGNGRLDASDCMFPICAVYKDTFPTNYGGHRVTTEILGLYSNTSGLTYKGVQLKSLPKQYTESHYYILTDTEKDDATPLCTGVKAISTLPTKQATVWDGWGRSDPVLSQSWLNGESVHIVQNEFYDTHNRMIQYSTYIDKNARLYSSNGVEIHLPSDDYNQYLKLEKEINKLLNKYDDVNDIFWRNWEQQDHSKKEENRIEKEQEYHERLQWTITTRNWIEAIEMYDGSKDYFTHKIEIADAS